MRSVPNSRVQRAPDVKVRLIAAFGPTHLLERGGRQVTIRIQGHEDRRDLAVALAQLCLQKIVERQRLPSRKEVLGLIVSR